jgi:hypothetical protein
MAFVVLILPMIQLHFSRCNLHNDQVAVTKIAYSKSSTGRAQSSKGNDTKVHFRTYGSDKYVKSKKRICQEANDTGWFETVVAHGPEDLPQAFVEQYRDILALPRGGGYWIWKLPVIEMALDQMDEGEILVYADAGCAVNKEGEQRFYQYLEMIQESPYNILSWEMVFPEFWYTTEQIFRAFKIKSSNALVRSSGQYLATVLIMEKGDHLLHLLSMVNAVLAKNPYIITDMYNKTAKKLNRSFVDNRHDQSLFSVSRKLLGSVVIHADETNPPKQQYPFWALRLRE